MQIRRSRSSDLRAISAILDSAFPGAEGPQIVQLVEDLLDDETALPLLSLVAESDGDLIGTSCLPV